MEQSELSLLACWWRKNENWSLSRLFYKPYYGILKSNSNNKSSLKLEIRIAENYLLKTLP